MVTPTSLRYDLEIMLKEVGKLIELDRASFERCAQGDLFEIQGLVEDALQHIHNVEMLWYGEGNE